MDRSAKLLQQHSQLTAGNYFRLKFHHVNNWIIEEYSKFGISSKLFYFLWIYFLNLATMQMFNYIENMRFPIYRILCINFQRKLKCRTFSGFDAKSEMRKWAMFLSVFYEGDKLSAVAFHCIIYTCSLHMGKMVWKSKIRNHIRFILFPNAFIFRTKSKYVLFLK